MAGTIKQYSKNAINQLNKMAFHKGMFLSFKKPYQANVIKIFEAISNEMVLIILDVLMNFFGQTINLMIIGI